jgi:hypothetical protein
MISKDGIKIDPNRIESIQKIDHPRNIKELQYFIGKINFLRRFIPNRVEILRNITNMLKKDTKIKWTIEAKHSFDQVKQALTQAPMIIFGNVSFSSLFIFLGAFQRHVPCLSTCMHLIPPLPLPLEEFLPPPCLPWELPPLSE